MKFKNWLEVVKLVANQLSYLDSLSSEYEIDKPEFAAKVQKFKKEKEKELSDLYELIIDISYQLDNYMD